MNFGTIGSGCPRSAWAFTGLMLLMLVVCHTDAAAQWSQFRGDAQRSATIAAPVQVGLQPGIRWRHTTGSAAGARQIADLDADEMVEVVSVSGGRLEVRRLDGTLLWDTAPVGARRVVDVRDVDADGTLEVVVDATNAVLILSGQSGQLLWSSPADLPVEGLGAIGFSNLVGGAPDELFFCDVAANASKPELTGQIFAYSFDAGLDSVVALPPTALGTRDYEAGYAVVAADIDADGRRELVAVGRSHVYAYDAETGALVAATPDLAGAIGEEFLAQGALFAADADGDGGDEVYVFTNTTFVGIPTRRIVALGWDPAAAADGAATLRLLWSYSAPDPLQQALAVPEPPIGFVSAPDTGASADFVYGWWSAEDGWVTRVVSALDGSLRAEFVQSRPLALVDPDDDGLADLLVAHSPFREPSAYAPKRLFRFVASGVDAMELGVASLQFGPFEAAFAPSQAGERVGLVDTDGDDWGDRADVVGYPGGDLVSQRPLGDIATGAVVGVAGAAPTLVVFFAAGAVASLSPNLSLLNDADGDQQPDLRLRDFGTTHVVGWGAPAFVLTPEAGGRVRLLNAGATSPGGAPLSEWKEGANINQWAVGVRDADGQPAALVVGRDKQRQLVVSARRNGQQLWTHTIGGPGGSLSIVKHPLVLDVDGAETGSSADEVFVALTDAAAGQIHRVVRIGVGPGWTSEDFPTAGGGAGELSASGDGESIYFTTNDVLRVLDAHTGSTAASWKAPNSHYYGTVVEAPLDDDAAPEWLVLGTAKGAYARDHDGSLLWEAPIGNASRAPAALLAGTSFPSVPATILAALQVGPVVVRVDARTGAELGRFALVEGDWYAADPAGWPDGGERVVIREVLAAPQLEGGSGWIVATSDGWVYAIDALGAASTPSGAAEAPPPVVMWSVFAGGDAGALAAVDSDGDGDMELAVPTRAGEVVLIDEGKSLAPAAVFENDCNGPAGDAQNDVDTQESRRRICLDWIGATGAESYYVSLVTEFGAAVAGQPFVTSETAINIDGLSLQVGVRYLARVRAVAAGVASAPRVSDGVRILDVSDPVIETFSAAPDLFAVPAVPGVASSTEIRGTATDATDLQAWTLTAQDEAGAIVRTWTSTVDGEVAEFTRVWDGLDEQGALVEGGRYALRWVVQDAVGRATERTEPVIVCAPPLAYDPTKEVCPLTPSAGDGGGAGDVGEDAHTPDGDGDEDIGASDAVGADGAADGASGGLDSIGFGTTGAKDVSGCGGCRQTSAGERTGAATWWSLVAMSWWWMRRRVVH